MCAFKTVVAQLKNTVSKYILSLQAVNIKGYKNKIHRHTNLLSYNRDDTSPMNTFGFIFLFSLSWYKLR